MSLTDRKSLLTSGDQSNSGTGEAQNRTYKWPNFSNRHRSSIEFNFSKLGKEGIDNKLNFQVAYATWMEIRRARGIIVQGLLRKDELETELVREIVDRKLSTDEIDRLANLTTLASVSNGDLFWKKDLKADDPQLLFQAKVLVAMRGYTNQVKDPDSYSRWGNAQVFDTLSDLIIRFYKNGVTSSDNLGDHFSWIGPYSQLEGVSIKFIREKVKVDPELLVVLAAAASSGVLEAGIYASYMNNFLKIPTSVDPVFINKGHSGVRGIVMNRVSPERKCIIIPMDDQVVGEGFSIQMAINGARAKYGPDSLLFNKRAHTNHGFIELS